MWKDKAILMALVMGALAGAAIFYAGWQYGSHQSDRSLVTEYYRVENLVSVSPYELKTALQRGEQDQHVVVDMRSPAEYEAGHVTGAINIPNYLPSDASGEENSSQRILRSFREVQADHPGKDIIAYCYSAACMVTRKAGVMLAEHDIYIKHLNIGWYEWRYYWTIWNGEDGYTYEDFTTVGAEPGVPVDMNDPIAPCGEGEFNC